MKDIKRLCPVCNNKNGKNLKTIGFHLPKEYQLPDNYSVVCCSQCGFCYADTTATLENYNNYYAKCNVYASIEKNTGDDNAVSPMLLSYLKNIILDKESKILDMGCGGGRILIELQKLGYSSLLGIDPSSTSVKEVNAKGMKAIIGNIYDLPKKEFKGKFDWCFLFGVIEHLLYPKKALEVIKQYLSENGKIILDTPNYEVIDQSSTFYPDHFNPEHINYFSKISLSNLLQEVGFVEQEIYKQTVSTLGTDIYSITGVFRKETKPNRNELYIEKDTSTLYSISRYFDQQSEVLERYNNIIKTISQNYQSIYIWGVGACTLSLCYLGAFDHCNIVAFIDNNVEKQGTSYMGKNIISPDNISDPTAAILVAVLVYSKEVEKQVMEMGIKNKLYFLK